MFSHTELFITNTILSPVCSSAAFTGERDGFTALRLVSRGLWRAGPLFRAVCLKWWGISSHEEPLCFWRTLSLYTSSIATSHSFTREREGERKRVKKDRGLERDSEKRERSFLADRDKWCSSLSCVWRYSREEGQTKTLFLFPPQTLEGRGLFLCSSHEHCWIYAEVDTSIAQ